MQKCNKTQRGKLVTKVNTTYQTKPSKTLTNKGRKQGSSLLLQQAEGFEFVAAALNHLATTKQDADFMNKIQQLYFPNTRNGHFLNWNKHSHAGSINKSSEQKEAKQRSQVDMNDAAAAFLDRKSVV